MSKAVDGEVISLAWSGKEPGGDWMTYCRRSLGECMGSAIEEISYVEVESEVDLRRFEDLRWYCP